MTRTMLLQRGYLLVGIVASAMSLVHGNPSLCIEKVANFKSNYERLISFATVPGLPDLIVMGSQSGIATVYRRGNVASSGGPFTSTDELEEVGQLIDISSRVVYFGPGQDESGMHSLVFHKDFANNGRFFLAYMCRDEQRCPYTPGTAIEEFKVVDPTSEDGIVVNTQVSPRLVFAQEQPYSNHNEGQILFSPDVSDAHLYITVGDGGGAGDPAGNAQNLQSLLGKILRIDVDSTPSNPSVLPYAIPPDNPFVSDATARDEIWAFGLRNPWRCSFDSENSDKFYCGDVGQSQSEEISLIVKGGNYGWRKFEGDKVYSSGAVVANNDAIPPIMAYDHPTFLSEIPLAASVTGGYVYRSNVDSSLYGKYVFADYFGPIFVAEETPTNTNTGEFSFEEGPGSQTEQFSFAPAIVECASSSPLSCSPEQTRIFTFGEDSYRDVYFISESGVHRIADPSFCDGTSAVQSTSMPGFFDNLVSPFLWLFAEIYSG